MVTRHLQLLRHNQSQTPFFVERVLLKSERKSVVSNNIDSNFLFGNFENIN